MQGILFFHTYIELELCFVLYFSYNSEIMYTKEWVICCMFNRVLTHINAFSVHISLSL